MRTSVEADFTEVSQAARQAIERPSGATPRLFTIPPIFSPLLKLNGGAFTIGHYVVIGRRFRDAPARVRRFVLAHECAHALRGHTTRLLGYWLVIFAGAGAIQHFAAPNISRPTVAIILGLAIALIELARPIDWELEADEIAARVTGVEHGHDNLAAVFRWADVPIGSVERKRLDALTCPHDDHSIQGTT